MREPTRSKDKRDMIDVRDLLESVSGQSNRAQYTDAYHQIISGTGPPIHEVNISFLLEVSFTSVLYQVLCVSPSASSALLPLTGVRDPSKGQRPVGRAAAVKWHRRQSTETTTRTFVEQQQSSTRNCFLLTSFLGGRRCSHVKVHCVRVVVLPRA